VITRVPLSSHQVHAAIDELLLTGKAATMAEAEEQFLNEHLAEIAELAALLPDEEFVDHEAVKLLLARGSRPWEDELR
jgi:hypothetical protein